MALLFPVLRCFTRFADTHPSTTPRVKPDLRAASETANSIVCGDGWAAGGASNPDYDLAHASIVPCHANLLAALRGEGEAETTGEDNLKTLALVFGAYDSARRDAVVHFS